MTCHKLEAMFPQFDILAEGDDKFFIQHVTVDPDNEFGDPIRLNVAQVRMTEEGEFTVDFMDGTLLQQIMCRFVETAVVS